MPIFITRLWAAGRLALLSLFLSPAPAFWSDWVTILHCHDGDTCRGADDSGLTLTLRLLGIDAPEVAPPPGQGAGPPQPYAFQARDQLRHWVEGKKIWVELWEKDPYTRWLALLFERPEAKLANSINERMLREGLALAYRGRSRWKELQKESEKEELRARLERRGLWSLSQPPLSPSAYRHLKRR